MLNLNVKSSIQIFEIFRNSFKQVLSTTEQLRNIIWKLLQQKRHCPPYTVDKHIRRESIQRISQWRILASDDKPSQISKPYLHVKKLSERDNQRVSQQNWSKTKYGSLRVF